MVENLSLIRSTLEMITDRQWFYTGWGGEHVHSFYSADYSLRTGVTAKEIAELSLVDLMDLLVFRIAKTQELLW